MQSSADRISSGNVVRTRFNDANVAGNVVVAYAIWNNTSSASLSDTNGNAYVSAGAPVGWSGGTWRSQVFYATDIEAGANVVSAQFGTAVSNWGVLYVHEYSGIDPVNPLDATQTATGNSSILNSGSLTTSTPNDLLLLAAASDNTISGLTNSYTMRSTGWVT